MLTHHYSGTSDPVLLCPYRKPQTAHHVVLAILKYLEHAAINCPSAEFCTRPFHRLHDGRFTPANRRSTELINTKWKGLSVFTASSSPIVVVLSGSMEPAFQRGDLLFLWARSPRVDIGEVVVCEYWAPISKAQS